ncbi:hypothetical protein DSM112329_04940 [Paraconexibacter sp. AEG42_29]|uniref:Methyltransferase type 11 domain-containing protein n=1 Tax=Paraconexibacter sp. AEG42_29 TaxID=2997339 RepID=A0AAU7B2G1_9ACTN
MAATSTTPLPRHYAGVCRLEDFSDPELAALMDDISPEKPASRPHRKAWEFAMGASYLQATGLLDGTKEILDVGAGSEEIAFWLAARARSVTAVDIYGRGAFGTREAKASMLEDPASFAPYDYPQDRLTVRDMDARKLEFPDASFDAVVSFSSIEHFGGFAGIKASAAEIGRVLRPGGRAFLVTETFVKRHPMDTVGVQVAIRTLSLNRKCTGADFKHRSTEVLSSAELQRLIVKPSGLTLEQPLQLKPSPATLTNLHTVQPDGTTTSATGDPFPHVLVSNGYSTFTSVCLPLVKPG